MFCAVSKNCKPETGRARRLQLSNLLQNIVVRQLSSNAFIRAYIVVVSVIKCFIRYEIVDINYGLTLELALFGMRSVTNLGEAN